MMDQRWWRCSQVTAIGALLLALGCGNKSKSTIAVTASPTGEVTDKLEVVLEFSTAMVADKHVGMALPSSPVQFSPAIAGEAAWRDPRTLVFVASASLPPSTQYTGTVSPSLSSLDGGKPDDEFSFQFTSERLAGELEVLGEPERAVPNQAVKVSFNQQVAFDQVNKHCVFTAGDREVSAHSAVEDREEIAKAYIVTPDKALDLDTEWSLSCAEALTGQVGDLGLAVAAKTSFRTYGPMQFVSLSPGGNDIVPDEDLRLEIAFTNPPADAKAMTLSPPVRGFPEQCHVGGEAPPAFSCAAMLEPNTHYTLTIKGEQTDTFGQSLGKAVTKKFKTANSLPTLSMDTGFVVAEKRQPSYPAWTRNVKDIDVTAVRVRPQTFHKLKPLLDWWSDDAIDFAKTGLKPVSKNVAIKATKNKWQQQPLRASDYFPGSETGMYYYEVYAPEVKHSQRKKVLVNVTDIGVVTKLSPTQGLVWATSLANGKPLAGARVSVRNTEGKQTWTGTTDESGLAMLPGRTALLKKSAEEVNAWDDVHVFVQKGDDWTVVNTSRTGGLDAYNFNVSADYNMAPVKLRGYMHTDRGLYRPGQVVHIKGLARETKLATPLRVPKNKKVDVEVRGPRRNVVTTSKATLSNFGGFWTDVTLPADARLGDYTVTAKLKHGSFTQRFSVEEYRPATFEVSTKADAKRLVRTGTINAKDCSQLFLRRPCSRRRCQSGGAQSQTLRQLSGAQGLCVSR